MSDSSSKERALSKFRAVLLEGREAEKETLVTVSAEKSSEDEVIIWVTKPGDEGEAHPGISLARSTALLLADAIRNEAGE